jgi:photosystem II stability/assembly factor-like uncharacterized protein
VAGVTNMGCDEGSDYFGGVYVTHDGGGTWEEKLGVTGSVWDVVRSPGDPRVYWAEMGNDPAGGIYRTTDGGATWAIAASGGEACDGQCSYNLVVRAGALRLEHRVPRQPPHLPLR